MLSALPSIRPEERRPLFLSLVTLLTIMASHALLETARDTFFLARLPAARLPWVYLAIAAASLFIAWVRQRKAAAKKKSDLASFLVLASLVNVVFGFGIEEFGIGMVYALYVWSGVFSTLAVVQFWNVVNAGFTVIQAKRLFAFIGVGGVIGAILGSAIAGGLSAMFSPRVLLIAAATIAGMAATVARVFCTSLIDADEGEERKGAAETGDSLWAPLAQVRNSPYLVRLGLVVWLSAFSLTLADYIFKDVVAQSVATENLGTFFSTTYFSLNVLSLLVQLFVVNWLMRTFGVSPLLAVLPLLASLGVVAVAVGGGLWAALAMKGADGVFRYSLHRTVVEVLYVPLNAAVRKKAKELLDVLGQRGGQAVASIVILGLVAIGGERWVPVAALVAFAAWIIVALELRPHYLNLFRERIETTTLASQIALPSLDLASLEALMGALNSTSDEEVIAAMDLLAEQGRANLIPALILYHPSTRIVRHALRVFSDGERSDFLPIAERLVGHLDPEVRAGVLRVRTRRLDDVEPLREALQDPATIVRATAVAGLAAAKGCGDEDVALTLDELLSRGTAEARLALARAIGDRPDPVCAWILVKLGDDTDDRVRRAAAQAMRSLPPDAEYVGPLVRMLGTRTLRSEARATLVAIGDLALAPLREALDDPTLDRHVRLHLPRTVSLFDPQTAADMLMARLPIEADGGIKFKLLRGLGMLRLRDERVVLDPAVIDAEIRATLDEACRFLSFRAEMNVDLSHDPDTSAESLWLLSAVLSERERYAVNRLFRFLHLKDDRDDFAHIHRGLRSDKVRVRASSRELLENRLDPSIRDTIMALVDDVDVRERAKRIRIFHGIRVGGVDDVLRWILHRGGSILKLLVLHHVAETGARRLLDAVEACEPNGDEEVAAERERALQRLSGRFAMPDGGAT